MSPTIKAPRHLSGSGVEAIEDVDPGDLAGPQAD